MNIEDNRVTELVAATKAETGGLKIVDEATYFMGGGILTKIAGHIKEIESIRKPNIDAANKLHKSLVAALKKDLEPFNEWSNELRAQMLSYNAEKVRKQREAQAKADTEALATAEKARQLDIEAAAALMEPEDVKVIAATPLVVTPVTVWSPPAPKVSGISTKTLWKFRVVDANLVPRHFLTVDEKSLGVFATNNHNNIPVAGVEFYSEQSMAVRA